MGLLLQLGVTVDEATANLLDRKQNDKRVWAKRACLAILQNGDAKRDDIDRFCNEIDTIASAGSELPDIETDDVSGVRGSLRLIKKVRDDIRYVCCQPI